MGGNYFKEAILLFLQSKGVFRFCVVVLCCFSGCAKEKSTPQETFEVMIQASHEGDKSKYLDCMDLKMGIDAWKAENPNLKIDEAQLKTLILNNPKATKSLDEAMDVLKNGHFVVQYERDLGPNTKELTISESSSAKQAKAIFVNRSGKWKMADFQTDSDR